MPQNRDYSDSSSETQAIAYKERLNDWAIARLLPNMQRVIVARFRSRSDAEGHMQLLRQLIPDACFVVVFDCQRDEAVI
ncbi:hypothetical protein [Tolypothrix sp. VBCCA 56010]|uniref:hypothetical protein n=1 Tax=Tolypothrix sp. VBCCA 56010 TaxID=3137731 RepID=UPI003D7DD37C